MICGCSIDGREVSRLRMAAQCAERIFNEEELLHLGGECVSVAPQSRFGEGNVWDLEKSMVCFLLCCFMGNADAHREVDGLEREVAVEALRSWVRGQGRSESTARKVVDLLQPELLLSEPRPRTWNRRGNFTEGERNRYLWYRHAARLLGWKERHQFPDFVRTLLKTEIYPSYGGPSEAVDEAAREVAMYTITRIDVGGSIGATSPTHGSGNAGHGGRSSVSGSGEWSLGFRGCQ